MNFDFDDNIEEEILKTKDIIRSYSINFKDGKNIEEFLEILYNFFSQKPELLSFNHRDYNISFSFYNIFLHFSYNRNYLLLDFHNKLNGNDFFRIKFEYVRDFSSNDTHLIRMIEYLFESIERNYLYSSEYHSKSYDKFPELLNNFTKYMLNELR